MPSPIFTLSHWSNVKVKVRHLPYSIIIGWHCIVTFIFFSSNLSEAIVGVYRRCLYGRHKFAFYFYTSKFVKLGRTSKSLRGCLDVKWSCRLPLKKLLKMTRGGQLPVNQRQRADPACSVFFSSSQWSRRLKFTALLISPFTHIPETFWRWVRSMFWLIAAPVPLEKSSACSVGSDRRL